MTNSSLSNQSTRHQKSNELLLQNRHTYQYQTRHQCRHSRQRSCYDESIHQGPTNWNVWFRTEQNNVEPVEIIY